MVNEAGAVVWSADYLPFGKATVEPASTVENNWRFPGQFQDAETGLHYNLMRFYAPNLGRYTRPDPANLKIHVGTKEIYALRRLLSASGAAFPRTLDIACWPWLASWPVFNACCNETSMFRGT